MGLLIAIVAELFLFGLFIGLCTILLGPRGTLISGMIVFAAVVAIFARAWKSEMTIPENLLAGTKRTIGQTYRLLKFCLKHGKK